MGVAGARGRAYFRAAVRETGRPPWTEEQAAIIAHPLDAHALVHAAPGAGKTTTLVGRVEHLVRSADARRIRVVMFNKAIQETFVARLEQAGIAGVKVTTFDALGLEVLGRAERMGLLSRPLEVCPYATQRWALEVHRRFRKAIDRAEDIEGAVTFWKARLIGPRSAACEALPQLAEAYQAIEALRLSGDALRVDFADMVYTAVGVLRQHPGLLGRIDHVLIDEFQDINAARIELLRRLIHQGTTVMAVGDADQAIYEFSGAHPRFFQEFAGTFPERPTLTYPLSHSFRFGPTIAGAARRLIAHNEDRFPIEVVGRGAHEGRIERVDDVPGVVGRLLAEGHPAPDLAVLYRGRVQGLHVVASLIARKIAIETEDLELLRTGRGPELALAYLRFATSDAPVDFDSAWALTFAPDRYIRKEAFAAQVRRLGRKGLRAVLANARAARDAGQAPGGIDAMQELEGLLTRMGRARDAGAALDLLTEEVDIREQLGGRIFSPAALEQAVAAFEALHVLLRGLAVRPADAARALTELDPRAGRGAEDCVWVSTIHKAKGKEWRTVLLPRLSEGLCPSDRQDQPLGTTELPGGVEQSDPLEQERRIFYVGLTRAAETVYLEVPAREPSRFVAEMEPPRPAPTPKGAGKRARKRAEPRPHEGAPWSAEDDAALLEARATGADFAAIGARVGRSADAVEARLVLVESKRKRREARRQALAEG